MKELFKTIITKVQTPLFQWLIAGITILTIVGFLSFRYFSPFGAIVQYKLNINNPAGIEPTQTLTNTASGSFSAIEQVMRNSTATIQLPLITKQIDGLWVRLKFKGNPRELKVGVKGSQATTYLYQPLYNEAIEKLTWDKLQIKDVTLWQKEKMYTSLDSFVTKPPKDKIIASYFVDPTELLAVPPSINKETSRITKQLRGTHTFYFLVNQNPLIITIHKSDANLYDGDDILKLKLTKGEQKIYEKDIEDDGATDKSGLLTKPQKETVQINNLIPGVYKLVTQDLSFGADVRIQSIEINQPSIMIASPIFVVDPNPTTLWTTAKSISAITNHQEALQTIRLDDTFDIPITKEKQSFDFDIDYLSSASANIKSTHQIFLPKNDIQLSGDGYFTFNQDKVFNPTPVKTTEATKFSDLTKADYILSRYTPVTKEGEWNITEAYFDGKLVDMTGEKLLISLESPNLASFGGEVTINSLEITTTKPSWFGSAPSVSNQQPATSPWKGIIDWFRSLFKIGK